MQGGVLLGVSWPMGTAWYQLVRWSNYIGSRQLVWLGRLTHSLHINCIVYTRYKCNRFNESDAQLARTAQQVCLCHDV